MASRQRIERDLITKMNMALEQGNFEKAESLNRFIQELHGGVWPEQREPGIAARSQTPPAMPAPDGGFGPRLDAPAAMPQNPPAPVPLLPRHPTGGPQTQAMPAPDPSGIDWIGAPPFPPVWQQIASPNRAAPDPAAGRVAMLRFLYGPDSLTEQQGSIGIERLQAPRTGDFTPQAPGQQRPYTVDVVKSRTIDEPGGRWILRQAIANARERDPGFADRFRAEIERLAAALEQDPDLRDSFHPAYRWMVDRIMGGAIADSGLRVLGESRPDGSVGPWLTAVAPVGYIPHPLAGGVGGAATIATMLGEGAHHARMGWANRNADDVLALLSLSPEQLVQFERARQALSRMPPRLRSRRGTPRALLDTIE